MNKCRFFSVILFLVFFLFLPLGANGETGLTSCSMIPLWSPQAQFAGYYVALEKGFYRKHGINMTILRGGPACSGCEYLKDGRADFAILWLTTAIRQCGEELQLVHLSQIIPRSSMMLVAKKSMNIRKASDMNGKKVGLWGGDLAIPPHAFFKKYGLQVKEIPQSYTVNLFLRGGVDIASAMWYNEYHTIMNAGMDPDELTIFILSDHGLNFPEDGLYCMEDTFKENPTLCCNFAEASIAGWRYAFAHPEEALDIVMGYMSGAKIATNRAHQRWMLSRMKDIILPSDAGANIGLLKEGQYYQVAQELKRNGFIDRIPGFPEIYRDCGTHAQE